MAERGVSASFWAVALTNSSFALDNKTFLTSHFRPILLLRSRVAIARDLRHSQSCSQVSEDQVCACAQFPTQELTFLVQAFFFLPGPLVEPQVNLAH